MKIVDFIQIAREITGERKLMILHLPKEKYQHYIYPTENDEIQEDTKYGVSLDNFVEYEFKVGKFESLLKTFVTQFVSKCKMKRYTFDDNGMRYFTKEEALKSLNNVSPRMAYLFAYSTNYGVGVWLIYVDKKMSDKLSECITNILDEKGIKHTGEYSDAFWVWRHKFAGSYIDHNEIVKEMQKRLKDTW